MARPRALPFEYQIRMAAIERLNGQMRVQGEEDRDRQLEDFLANLNYKVDNAPSGLAYVIRPAYAGFREGLPTAARFGNVAGDPRMGFGVEADGNMTAIGPDGSGVYMHARNPGNTAWQNYAAFRWGPGGSFIQNVAIGAHPNLVSRPAIWPTQDAAPNAYMLLGETDASHVYLNAKSAGHLRIANNESLSWADGGITCFAAPNPRQLSVHGIVWAERAAQSADWSTSQIVCRGMGDQGRVAIHCPGYAPQWRSTTSEGEMMTAVNTTGAAYRPIGATAFTVVSSEHVKRSIRSLRQTAERIIVRRPVDSDVAELPNIMDLRPVAFRPREDVVTKLGGKDGMETVPEDCDVFVREATRERIGLIAEEVAEVIPSAVSHRRDGSAVGIDYAQVTVALLDHVQQLTNEVSTLRRRVAQLEGATAT